MKIKKRLICLILAYILIAMNIVQGSVLSNATGSVNSSGDLNNDGIVNMADVIFLATKFNTVSGDGKYVEACDLNNDGVINMADVIIIASSFNAIITISNTPTKRNTPTKNNTPTSTPTQVASKVKANEVVWIGDSWIQMPGTQHTRVRDLARSAGVLGANEDFVDLAVSGSTLSTICNQYHTRQAGSVKVKYLIMDGGGIDMWQANGSQAQAQRNVDAFKQFLAKVKSDGTVQKMIYYIYPSEQVAPGVTYWKPLMQKACEESPIPCYFVDLAPLFSGHPEYMGSDGIHPSDSGGKVVGNAVWDAMKKNEWF